MALSDTEEFLIDLLQRYDPDIDLSDGSRAQTDVIEPILERLGPDPFDDDISTFVVNRIQQVYPDLAITEEDALRDTLMDPMRVLIEPIVREIKLVKLRSSLANIESLSDQEVDALVGNFFESRISGGFAVGVVRLYFSTPQSISVALTNPASTRGGLRFFPTRPQTITADQMLLNVSGSEYYFDVNMTAENRGTEYNVEPGEIVSMANLPTATRVRNERRFRDGTPRETSIELAARAEASVSDKTLTVKRGVIRTLSESFPSLRRLFVIGYRDPEMQRDIIKGGGLGPIPEDDSSGTFYGTASPVDDLDGDLESAIVEATSGFFVSRIGSVGTDPESWYLSVTYTDPTTGDLVAVDARITEVISATQVRTDTEYPLGVTLVWVLREKVLTISDIPGGITLPDSIDGSLEIRSDEVHIGGKTDVYAAAEPADASAQITSLTDEVPAAIGINAETDAALVTVASADIIILNDSSLTADEIEVGWSLVLEEGVDAGSYRILAVADVGTTVQVTLDRDATGTQANLSWKIVDDITTELTDPKDIKLTGSDAVTAAGSTTVTTASSSNFLDARVQVDDILRLEGDELIEGDYTIEEVNAVTIEVDPPVARSASAIKYSIFRRSEAVEPPLVRISSLELLDSSGAPVGTEIPYRDPVLARSNAFQNEGSTVAYEDTSRVGLVSFGVAGSNFDVGSRLISWTIRDPEDPWTSIISFGNFTFPAGPARDAATVVSEFNADALLLAAGVRAIELSYGGESYVGFYSDNLLTFTAGDALPFLGLEPEQNNTSIRSVTTSNLPGVLIGDAVEVMEGSNSGRTGRVLYTTLDAANEVFATVGKGPLGPVDGVLTYDAALFLPDVGVRVRIGRPSVGSSRVYFLSPTSAEFSYRTANFFLEGETRALNYQPDPENRRVVIPAPPTTTLPNTGVTDDATPDTLTDTGVDFELLNVGPGDLLEVLYIPIDGTVALPATGNIAVGGLTLKLRFDLEPFITISFPFDQPRQAVIDYINEQVGQDLASLGTGDVLRLQTISRRLEVDSTSTALTVLGLASSPTNNDHPDGGTYIIASVSGNVITVSDATAFTSAATTSDTQYRIERYLQRASSTEMNLQQDATGMYYMDVELRSVAPGNEFNIEAGETLVATGYVSDGYRLSVENDVLTFSRAEELTAEISRTILLVGSSDSPEEYVQLSQQNVQVNYDRSELVDEIQSFADSDQERVVCQEILSKHLLPHYLSVNWGYVGGSSEAVMERALNDAIDAVEPDTQLEISDMVEVLRRRGASSVYTIDTDARTGRRAPLMVAVLHNNDRTVQAVIVNDFISITRLHRYIPDNISLNRVSTGGIS